MTRDWVPAATVGSPSGRERGRSGAWERGGGSSRRVGGDGRSIDDADGQFVQIPIDEGFVHRRDGYARYAARAAWVAQLAGRGGGDGKLPIGYHLLAVDFAGIEFEFEFEF